LNNIFAVIVTYGDRFQYLEQVIGSLIKERIDRIVIVSNGLTKNTLKQIKELQTLLKCIDIVALKKNTGSANGYAVGITQAIQNGADYIWLLDDDNKPSKGSLDILKKELNLPEFDKFKNIKALLSYRKDRTQFADAIDLGIPDIMLGNHNSFLGFDIFSKKIKKDFVKNIKQKGFVAVAPYGGLIFHKDLIEEIGLPNKNFFLYGDDYDFSYRITKKGGLIYLIKESRIVDLETSFHLKKYKGKFQTRYFKTNSKDKIFYSVRNGIIFEQNFVKNKIKYFINKWVYLTLLFMVMLIKRKHFWKFNIIMQGVKSSHKKLDNEV